MKHIKVFQDYSSSGLWEDDTGYMIDYEDLIPAVPQHLIIALKYWHDMWDYRMSNPTDDPDHRGMSQSYIDQWYADILIIIEAMNAVQHEFYFRFIKYPI
jgi:hypothetical protein